jgi:hypothetical protein
MYSRELGHYHPNERPAKVYRPYRYRVSAARDPVVVPRLFRRLSSAKNFAKGINEPEIYDMQENKVVNLLDQYYAKEP